MGNLKEPIPLAFRVPASGKQYISILEDTVLWCLCFQKLHHKLCLGQEEERITAVNCLSQGLWHSKQPLPSYIPGLRKLAKKIAVLVFIIWPELKPHANWFFFFKKKKKKPLKFMEESQEMPARYPANPFSWNTLLILLFQGYVVRAWGKYLIG